MRVPQKPLLNQKSCPNSIDRSWVNENVLPQSCHVRADARAKPPRLPSVLQQVEPCLTVSYRIGMKFLVFLGSARDSTPPRPARLGHRVSLMCCRYLSACHHDVDLVDPLDLDTSGIFKPHFAYAQGCAPQALDDLAEAIVHADGFVMVSPEYNHAMSPALAHLLNHFGASRFAWKPSAIVTYSAGQWGGARAAMGMRGFLSELGCLPVS
jgi:hypothetical protein